MYAAADAAQVSFVDAPVSGGQAGAVNGQLVVMCGGDARRLPARRTRDHGLCQALQAARRKRGGAAHQDGQPDLHRRARAGAFRGAPLRREGGARRARGDRGHQGRRGGIVADGEPVRDDAGRPLRPRLRGGLDAQGPWHLPCHGERERGEPARDGARRPVLQGRPEDGRRAVGYVEPLQAACARWGRGAGKGLCALLSRSGPIHPRDICGSMEDLAVRRATAAPPRARGA